jgi:N6-adenosine-specific RNA methylase IME4
MIEEKQSPAGEDRAERVCIDKTHSPPTPSTQENSLITLTGNKYGVIYADPPWLFRTWSAKGTGRSAISHYDCLRFEALARLPIADLAARDCALFLWAINPLLDQAFKLIPAWGFKYKTVGFCWVKKNRKSEGFFTGLGYWTRANAEQCLLATRGRPKRRARDVRSLIVEPRREHSRKPDAVREQIERLLPGPYLELFAREIKPGWDCWGDQAGLFDQGTVVTRRQPSRLIG